LTTMQRSDNPCLRYCEQMGNDYAYLPQDGRKMEADSFATLVKLASKLNLEPTNAS
jgi:hypothetical protein